MQWTCTQCALQSAHCKMYTLRKAKVEIINICSEVLFCSIINSLIFSHIVPYFLQVYVLVTTTEVLTLNPRKGKTSIVINCVLWNLFVCFPRNQTIYTWRVSERTVSKRGRHRGNTFSFKTTAIIFAVNHAVFFLLSSSWSQRQIQKCLVLFFEKVTTKYTVKAAVTKSVHSLCHLLVAAFLWK